MKPWGLLPLNNYHRYHSWAWLPQIYLPLKTLPLTLSIFLFLCMPCNKFSSITQFLGGWLHTLCNFSPTTSMRIKSRYSSWAYKSETLSCTPCVHKFHVISSELTSRNRPYQHTPSRHYALLTLARRRETIETYFKISQIHASSHVNACTDTRTINNREFKIKHKFYHSPIHIDASTPRI